ncbi:NUDIX domain-containing protein [Pelagovum pacificum]|uniref:NUDIX domain-containing protein n=1 Tax=Pelagovum pacificum TaxID=2588711 RepID=A0A5C5GFU8_9RHOB|nr:NUDIX domain-containing protein [Pelagovum pacificum]QQA43232.1 NUDIX domain-containing protein [Pelagovum pacificum]TNY33628.1 NUDIX domain-containing protein [Pelagovum pacificum]
MQRPIRLAVRGIILRDDRLLLVNAYAGRTDLWCAPGGGAEPHQGLPENLVREVHEETGLTVGPGEICLVNEFHAPGEPFHQVDIYFRCTLVGGDPDGDWMDVEGVVTHRRWVTREELATLNVKPDSLGAITWSTEPGTYYDPIEPIVR